MDKGDPTLVILSPGFPASEADTTCLPMQQDIVHLLQQMRPSLKIVVVSFQYPFTATAYEWKGVPILPLNGRNRGKVRRLLTWVRAWRAVSRLRKRYPIIGLLSFWCTECALVGSWFGRRYGIRHRCWMMGQDARPGNGLIKWVRPQPDELVALSDVLADECYRNYRIRPARIIPSGIDPAHFGPAPAARTIDLLAVGSLIPLKQHDIVVEVVRRLKEKRAGISALICGKGPEEGRLRALIREYGLEGNIELAGELPHPEVLRRMQQARILVHPSSYEGFGTVCLEALYAGAEVISFCRPMRSVISNWHIVADTVEMTGKVLEILERPESNHQPVLPYTMRDNVQAILELFPYKELPI